MNDDMWRFTSDDVDDMVDELDTFAVDWRLGRRVAGRWAVYVRPEASNDDDAWRIVAYRSTVWEAMRMALVTLVAERTERYAPDTPGDMG